MRTTPSSLLTLAALSLLAILSAAKAQTRYAVTDLGIELVPTAINNHGQILIGSTIRHANGAITQIGFLPGDTTATFSAINDAGEVVGNSWNSTLSNPPVHTFLYTNGRLVNLGTNIGAASAINNSNELIGYFPRKSNVAFEVLYTGGHLVDIGTIPPSTFIFDPAGINNAGQVAGLASLGNGTPPSTFIYSNGHFRDIPNFQPYAINDAAQVVGETSSVPYGFACLYATGHLTNLGTFPGTVSSRAEFINDSGEIIGLCFPKNQDASPAQSFLDKGGVMRPLTTPGWIVYELLGFNNAGQIIGGGITTSEIYGEGHGLGDIHGVLLTPQTVAHLP
jgi:probable HAF family extracellular repeat protein